MLAEVGVVCTCVYLHYTSGKKLLALQRICRQEAWHLRLTFLRLCWSINMSVHTKCLDGIGLQSPRPPTEVPNARRWKQPKDSRKGCRVGHGKAAKKQPEKQPKHPKNSAFRLFFQLFFGCFTVTHPAPFSAVFRRFSMSGIWHLCWWPRRLQE